MKKILFILALFFCLDLSAQTRETIKVDTLTNADTVTYTLGSWDNAFDWNLLYQADSLSGSTAGTFTIETQLNGGEVWYTLESITINGVQTLARKTGSCEGGKMRFKSITSGTQSTRQAFDFARSVK